MSATQMLQRAVLCQPDRTATVYGARAHTWTQVHDRVARLASALQALGLQPGSSISAIGMNSDRYFELFYAIPWAGGFFAPLNIRWSVRENAFALNDSGASILFVDDDFLEHGRQLQQLVPAVTTLIYLGDGQAPDGTLSYEELINGHAPVPDADRQPDDLYVVFYTSGTTAQSKGVALTHRNAVFTSVGFLATLPSTDDLVHLHVGGMFHLSGSGPSWYITLAAGTHVILPKFEQRAVMATIEKHAVTNIVLVPTMINLLLNDPDLASHDLTSLRTCVYGGSPMPETILALAVEKLPHCAFHQIYGMTETTGYATALRWQDHLDGLSGKIPGILRSAGRPVPGMEVRICDPDGNPLPAGETGEIVMRGDNVMMGYFNNPEATPSVLSNSGWMRSGDAGYLNSNGYLFVADRVKDMIISGGENVYSVDVERALYQHPAVLECAVIGIPNEKWGESVHAVIVLAEGETATGEELIAHCRTLIGGYKCPRSVEFVDGPLPTTAVGKIRKNVLREPYWEGREVRI